MTSPSFPRRKGREHADKRNRRRAGRLQVLPRGVSSETSGKAAAQRMDNAVISGQIGRRIVSFIDLGTNSLRMLVARVNDSGVVRVLNEAKHMVRLGEGEFGQHLLQPEPMARTMEMLHVFADMCQAYGVDEIVAVATSAVRDAENGEEFLNRVREETGLNIRIISGREEARLIWRGVSSGLEKSDELRLFVDIGGGLGVDYDGTRSANSESSVNYSIQEYVNDSISTLVDASDKNGIPHPNIITESGRSLTAHHSVLIFEVLETATLPEMDEDFEVGENDHELVHELYEIWDNLNQSRMVEAWHDAQQIREEALDLFSHGIVDLKTRAQIERLYWSVTREINQIASGLKHAPDEFRKLDKLLADKYFCNFSLFQSLPDSWAIDQIFPIMPIQRLDEKPDRNATLQDITCDSDGKIANFISTRYVSHDLPVHSLKGKDAYYIGVFLVGAYQEILGDMHNLFGDTNAVHVTVDDKGYSIDQVIDGETVAEVLDYVQYNPKKLVRTLETWVTKSVKEGRISVEEGKEFLSNYRSGLYGYTYLE